MSSWREMNSEGKELQSGTIAIEIGDAEIVCDWRGAAYIPDHNLLMFSDLHFEKGSSFARRGTFIPPYDTHETLGRVDEMVAKYNPSTVICLGDSFHDESGHSRIPSNIYEGILRLANGRDWCWISGNHDPTAPATLPGYAADELAVGVLTFRHEPLADNVVGEVSGHLHPAARIIHRGRTVHRMCFATDGNRLIMPAFGSFTGSLNVLAPAYQLLFDWGQMQALLLGKGRIYPIPAALLATDRSCLSRQERRSHA